MNKKTKIAFAVTALVGVGAVSMTYAYWSQTAVIDNPFDTGSFGTTAIEEFKPKDGENWEPGATVDKVVYVENTGSYDVIARAKLDENWYHDGDGDGVIDTAAYKTVEAADKTLEEDAADADTLAVYNVYQADDADGKTAADDTIVAKNWADNTSWVDGGDGWYYYYQNLAAGETSDSWLQSVTLIADADMGLYHDNCYVAGEKASDDAAIDWVLFEADSDTLTVPSYFKTEDGAVVAAEEGEDGATEVYYSMVERIMDEDDTGYADSEYVLTVTIETVQATKDAVAAMFGSADEPTGVTWTLTDADAE